MKTEKVKSAFQLLATSIKHMELNNNFIYFMDNDEIEKSFNVEYEVDDISLDEEEGTLIGTISLIVNAIVENEDAEMNFELILQGCFITEEETTTEEFRNLLEVNGCATLYSIARAIILSVSGQACVGAHVLLPMINLFKLKEAKVEEETRD